MQLAHKEIEDADEQEIAARARKKKAYAMAEKSTRELEKERAKLAHMSLQNAQETGQMAQGYGIRHAINALRGVLQQSQRLDGFLHLDTLEGVLNHLDPCPYQGNADPIILGLEVSEEESMSGSASSVAEEEHEEGKEATKKRRRGTSIERRWSTAEGRERQRRMEEDGDSSDDASSSQTSEEDSSAAVSIAVDGPQSEIKEASATLQRSVANLQHAVEVNQQIALQERLQRQQDVEVSAMHAVALLTGEHERIPPAQKVFAPNPRLELTACRRVASTPGRAGEAQGRLGARVGRDKDGQAQAAGSKAQERIGREASRSRWREHRR